MAEYEVTGVRYQMGDGLTKEEMTRKAEAFIRSLKVGTPLTLLADNTNPSDKNAIAVYLDERRVGFINKNHCEEIIPLLDADERCEAKVSGNDGHVTFFVEIEGEARPAKRVRMLPDFPLQESIRLDFSSEEKSLRAFAPQLLKYSLNANSPTLLEDARMLIEKTEKYMPLAGLSFCHEDNLWRDGVLKLLRKACKRQLPDDEKERLNRLRIKLNDIVGDFHSPHEDVLLKVFDGQLEMLKKQAEGDGGLFQLFERKFDGKPIEVETLVNWFKSMPDVRLYDYHNHKVLAKVLNYLRVSRRELYDVFAALLLIGKYGNEQDKEEECPTAKPEKKNYEAPKINLENLLKQDWFKEWRTDDKYNDKWICGFVEELMQSEWRELIADEWSVKNKRLTLKCQIIGVLKDAGVLRGNYTKLAKAIGFTNMKPESAAKYMGMGKRLPYEEWIKTYVNKG